MNNFMSIKKNVETEIIVKKSKFICNLIRVESQKEAEESIKKIKKKYLKKAIDKIPGLRYNKLRCLRVGASNRRQ